MYNNNNNNIIILTAPPTQCQLYSGSSGTIDEDTRDDTIVITTNLSFISQY